jgi:hypothetical protein
MLMRSALFLDTTQHHVVIVYPHFGMMYRSHLQGSKVQVEKTLWLTKMKMGPIHCPERLANHYHMMVSNIPEECISYTSMLNSQSATLTHPCSTPSLPHLHIHAQLPVWNTYTSTLNSQSATLTHPCSTPSLPHLHIHAQLPVCHTYTSMLNSQSATLTHPRSTPSMKHLHIHAQLPVCHSYTSMLNSQSATLTHPCSTPSMKHLHIHAQLPVCHTYTSMLNSQSATLTHPALVCRVSSPGTAIFRLQLLTPLACDLP